MVKNRKLSNIMDAGWRSRHLRPAVRQQVVWRSMFVSMLEYKALWHDRVVQKINRFFPSSQMCSCCGYVNPEVKDLDIREWTCLQCNVNHLRALNAAINIRNEGLRLIAAVGAPEALNACGESVRPEDIQAGIDEARIA